MNEFLLFAQSASPIAILAMIALGLVGVVYKLVKGENILSTIRGVQDEKYPILEKHAEAIEKHLQEIEIAYFEQKRFRENHSMHEIPEIVKTLERLEAKVDKIGENQYAQGLDVARLKALMEK